MRDYDPDPTTQRPMTSRPSGTKAVKQMRQMSAPSMHNSRREQMIVNTQDYFLEQVDPLIGDCISHLLITQPTDIAQAMLVYFQSRLEGTDPVAAESATTRGRPKREQKIYLATSIGPIVAKLINRIARSRPRNVLDYMCKELNDMIQEELLAPETSEPPPLPKQQTESTPKFRSSTRNRLDAAKALADTVSAPLPEPKPEGLVPSSTRSRIEAAKVLAESIAADSIASQLSPRREARELAREVVSKSIEAHLSPKKQTKQSPKKAEPRAIQIALLGLGGGGKSSVVNMIQGNFDSKIRPTIGFRPILMMLGEDVKVRFYDLGGGPKIRDIWDQYYHDVHAVMYVVDSAASPETHADAVKVFQTTMKHPFLEGKPLLVVANKQDKEGALSEEVVKLSLGISEDQYTTSKVIPSRVPMADEGTDQDSLVVDSNIEAGLEWILEIVQSKYAELNDRVVLDTKKKAVEEAKKRIERERKVLRNKIAAAFPHLVDPSVVPPDMASNPEDVFTEEEGVTFLASEIGEDVEGLSPVALQACALVGYQRLALQIIGALNAPISKKKTPMSWVEILDLILELRSELGMLPV